MSVKVMSHVWEHSKQRGPRLLVLLAIADAANDDGFCWLGMPKLSRKARQDAGNTRNYIQQIEQDKELIVYERKTDDGSFNLSNLYKVVMPGTNSTPPEDLKGKLKRRAGTPKKKGTGKNWSTPEITGGGGNLGSTPTGKSTSTVGVNLPPDPLQDPSIDSFAPDGAPASPIEEDLLETVTLYPCSTDDIVAMISAWWDWIPLRPTKRGEVIASKNHYANKTIRTFAQNLVQRGVMPADMIRFLGDIRFNEDSRWAYLRGRELPFNYIGEILPEWVEADRAENWYTAKDPRITPRKPGLKLDFNEFATSSNPLEDFADHPDFIVDLPRSYISPHTAPIEEMNDGNSSDDPALLEELAAEGITL